MDSEYALGRMVKKVAPVKTGVCVPIVAEPVTGQPYGMLNKASLQQTVQEWQIAITVFLGAPMHMQCKETHK